MFKWREWPIALVFVALEWGAGVLGPYGWFIDELYYRACSTRLAWGFVDHPPLSVAGLAVSRALFGDSFIALRLWPALGVAGAALLSSKLVERFGGDRFARLFAVSCVLSSPAALVMGSFYSMNAFEPLLWSACALAFMAALERGGPRWLGFGALLGISILNKHTSATFGAALVGGSLLTSARGHYRTRWPWLAALVAAVIVLPNLLWQVHNGWPSLEFYDLAYRLKNIPTSPLRVVLNQLLITGPGAAPVALLGVWVLLSDRSRPAPLAFGVGFVLLLAALMLSRSSRADRLFGYYPIVFAAGAVALERVLRTRTRWLEVPAFATIALSAAVFIPVTLPLLPPGQAAAYATAIRVVPQVEKNRSSALPQWLADRLAWRDFVRDIATVYRSLSPEEQAHALLFAPSYGEAGALELWGPEFHLPPVLSSQNTYHLWSQRFLERPDLASLEAARQTVWIGVGLSREVLDRSFERVDEVGAFHCDVCIDWRRDRRIWVARSAREPMPRFWAQLKHFE